MLSSQIEKTKRVLNKIIHPNQNTLILENQIVIMEKLKEIYNILDTQKK